MEDYTDFIKKMFKGNIIKKKNIYIDLTDIDEGRWKINIESLNKKINEFFEKNKNKSKYVMFTLFDGFIILDEDLIPPEKINDIEYNLEKIGYTSIMEIPSLDLMEEAKRW